MHGRHPVFNLYKILKFSVLFKLFLLKEIFLTAQYLPDNGKLPKYNEKKELVNISEHIKCKYGSRRVLNQLINGRHFSDVKLNHVRGGGCVSIRNMAQSSDAGNTGNFVV
jgi:hypothetical protein